MSHVLLVDDDVELCEMLSEYLRQEGFSVQSAYDGEQGVKLALSGHYDVLVLDVMLPKLCGFDALRSLRSHSQIPVLMLTARGDDVDRIVGLEIGADDYLSKPCNPRELVARIRAILRRTGTSGADPAVDHAVDLHIGDIEVRPGARQVLHNGRVLDLTSTEFDLLYMLVRNAGQVVSKGRLSQKVLGRKLERYDRSIDMHISKLRRKLGTHTASPSLIHTVRGSGYQFTVRS